MRRGGALLDRGTAVTFRHELARQAILDVGAPRPRVEPHRRVLTSASVTGSRDHRRLAHHALACGDAAAVLAMRPGQRSSRTSWVAPGGGGASADSAAAR